LGTNRPLWKTLWSDTQLPARRERSTTGHKAGVVGVSKRGEVLPDPGVGRHHRWTTQESGGAGSHLYGTPYYIPEGGTDSRDDYHQGI